MRGLTKRQHGQRKSNGIILIRSEEKQAVPCPSPDKHVGDNPSHEMRRVHSHSADPVQRDEVPGQGTRNGADVDEARGGAVAEVGEAEIEEVDDEEEERQPVVRAHPQVDKAEEQQVGGDVVGADVGCSDEVGLVGGPEGVGVDKLEGEENDPEGLLVWGSGRK